MYPEGVEVFYGCMFDQMTENDIEEEEINSVNHIEV